MYKRQTLRGENLLRYGISASSMAASRIAEAIAPVIEDGISIDTVLESANLSETERRLAEIGANASRSSKVRTYWAEWARFKSASIGKRRNILTQPSILVDLACISNPLKAFPFPYSNERNA